MTSDYPLSAPRLLSRRVRGEHYLPWIPLLYILSQHEGAACSRPRRFPGGRPGAAGPSSGEECAVSVVSSRREGCLMFVLYSHLRGARDCQIDRPGRSIFESGSKAFLPLAPMLTCLRRLCSRVWELAVVVSVPGIALIAGFSGSRDGSAEVFENCLILEEMSHTHTL